MSGDWGRDFSYVTGFSWCHCNPALPWRPFSSITDFVMEVNAIFTALNELQARTELLRGYL